MTLKKKRRESKFKLAARIAKAANTRRARTLAAKLAAERRAFRIKHKLMGLHDAAMG